jgi:aspartate/methionine/tyrosine aminotransferase
MTRNVLARRVQGFGTSIFTEISALAVQHGAINLGQGFPDFAGPAWVKRAAAEAIAADLNQYAPSPGLPVLRQSIADHWARAGWRGGVDPASEVTVTSGATEALCAAILGLIDPGDEVILFEPAYDAYGPDVIMAGGVPRYVRLYPPASGERGAGSVELPLSGERGAGSVELPLSGERGAGSVEQQQSRERGAGSEEQSGERGAGSRAGSAEQPGLDIAALSAPRSSLSVPRSQDWWFRPEDLAAAFTERTRAIIVNTPHNPTGKVFTRAELELIARLCREHDAIAIADEVYDQLVFDGAEHVQLATLDGMWERTLTINSTGKTFSVTGWKVGYAVGPANLNHSLRQAHQWTTFATATPFQQAAAVALREAPALGYYDELRREYLERRDLLAQVLHEAGLPTLPARGSYFLMADIGATGFGDDAAFCRWLTAEVGVAAIPPSVFYGDAAAGRGELPLLARFCFAKGLDTIRAAGERLRGLGGRIGSGR